MFPGLMSSIFHVHYTVYIPESKQLCTMYVQYTLFLSWSYVQSPMNCTCSTTRWNWKCYDIIELKSFISMQVSTELSWMVKGAIKSPSSTVLVFHRNWTWIAACVSNYKTSNVCFLILHHAANKFVSICIQLATLTIIIQDGNLDQVQKKLVLLQLQKWQSSLSPPKEIINYINYKTFNIVVNCSSTQC